MAKFKITATAMTTVVKEIEAPTKEEVHDYVMQIVAVVEEEMGVSEA